MTDLDCAAALSHLPAFLEGEAEAALTAALERHLADCAGCRAVVARLRQTAQFYHAAPQPAFPAAARERLYRALALDELLRPPPANRP